MTAAGLAALAQRLWCSAGEGGPVQVTWDGERPPPNSTLVEDYLVLPSVARPRFLLPADSPTTASAALAHYNRLRAPRTRVVRAALALALRSHLVALARPGRMRVWLRSGVAPAERAELLPVEFLRRELAEPGLRAAAGVHGLDPNHKPTLQLFAPDGSPLGFAKVGWSPSTGELVRNEARALGALGGERLGRVHVPRLLLATQWRGLDLAVVEPLPREVRRYRGEDVAGVEAAAGDVAGRDVGRRGARQPLLRSAYWAERQHQVDRLRTSGDAPDLAAALQRCLDRLSATAGQQVLRFGRWHGDWVPWNLAVSAAGLHAFDWEHSASEVPVGLDLAHWAFQVSLVLHGSDAAAAAAAADAACRDGWPRLDVPPAQGRCIATLYLVEMALRTWRLQRAGGGWNERLHPGLARVLAGREVTA